MKKGSPVLAEIGYTSGVALTPVSIQLRKTSRPEPFAGTASIKNIFEASTSGGHPTR
jgi:hypothetical protein